MVEGRDNSRIDKTGENGKKAMKVWAQRPKTKEHRDDKIANKIKLQLMKRLNDVKRNQVS